MAFRGDVWTCERVAGSGTRSSVSRTAKARCRGLLKRLEWTPQVPITRAIQRDEAAIERWRTESWPVLRAKARCERRGLVFVDESGFYLLPGVVKTYAPKGWTPVVDEWQTRDPLSVVGGVTAEAQVDSLVRPKSLNGLHGIEFLVHLGRLVVELHNLTCLDLEQLHIELHLALGRVRQRLSLVQSFFEGAGLVL